MIATTKITAKMAKINETITSLRSLVGSRADIVKVLVNETKWHETFGLYDPKQGKMVSTRRKDFDGVPVEFADVKDAEIVLSVNCEYEQSAKTSKK